MCRYIFISTVKRTAKKSMETTQMSTEQKLKGWQIGLSGGAPT
jgi:hypothetical protein